MAVPRHRRVVSAAAAVAVGLIALSACRGDGTQDGGAGDRSTTTDVAVPSTAPTTTEPSRPTSTVASTTATTAAAVLEPAESAFPAAGACAAAGGTVGNVAFNDQDFVPQPRCLIVRGNQQLSVTNRTAARLGVSLGTTHKAFVGPNETYVFPGSVSTYLARGVHRLVSTSSTAEIWVDPV